MVIKNPATNTGITAGCGTFSSPAFITNTSEQEGLVTPPDIYLINITSIILWASVIIIMFAIFWYHITISVSRIVTRWRRRKYQDLVPIGEEERLLESSKFLRDTGLPKVPGLREECAPENDVDSVWSDESDNEDVDDNRDADTDTNKNKSQRRNGNARPSKKAAVAASIYGSLDPVPDRRIVEDEVEIIVTAEEDNINMRLLEEYQAYGAERWRLDIGVLDEAERERVHWRAEWMRTQAHEGFAHSPSDFWYR
ncbi:hypothetical protein EYC84_009228 [Monilinia fructicola]|uniref:Uncharacterized protein n=1 Tax=Monilinia fructicola TaxID=38448 RepID=A0A5M9JHU2_MONFR|nr:hypothetical protein EYC84_009228 [Monilinia fructicola]